MNRVMNRLQNRRLDNHRLWLLLGLLATFSLSLFLIPAFVIRPFRHQSERALDLAIAVKRIAPPLTLAALVGVLALSVRLWRRSSRVLRTGIVIALVLSVASAVMVRQNYFEWMFHPIAAAGFISAGDARLGDKEMVMAVRIGREARAYPIVQMAYHHILNDTVGEVPIAVTY
jgi:O-antigen ligase